MRRIIYILGLLLVFLPRLALAQTQTWQAQPGYVASIQAQLNNLQSQINSFLLPPGATAGQFVVENAAGTAYVAATISGDISASVTTPGQLTVTSLSGNPVIVKNIKGNSVGGPYGITNLNWNQIVDPQTYGVKYDMKSVNDMVCTNGSPTCTSATAAFCNGTTVPCTGTNPDGTPQTTDVGKLIEIQGLPGDWQANHAYSYGDYVLPLSNNALNVIYGQQFTGTSGSSAPVPANWVASTYYSGSLRTCVLPTVNNAGNYVHCLNSGQGGPSGTTAPTWNQTPGGLTTDNALSWKNEGTSTWCQAGGCIMGDGPSAIWVNTTGTTSSLPWVVNEFTGCIQAVTNATTIKLGQLSSGSCNAANFGGNATPGVGVGLLAFYTTDNTAAMQTAINSFRLGQASNYGASGKIVLRNFIGISDSLLADDVAVDIECPGMNSHLGMAASFPNTGGGFVWFGQGTGGNDPMFHIEGLNTRIRGCGMYGSNAPANRPSSYFELQQSGTFGTTAYTILENNYDTTLSNGNYAFGGATDGIRLVASTQMDRNIFRGNAFDAVRACLADLNTQSVNTVFDNNTCQQTPISIYMPNGGDLIARGDQFLNDGQTMWLGQQAHVTISDTGTQFSPFQKYPHQFIYCAGGVAAGCSVETVGRVGDVPSEYLPFANGTAWGHTFHTGSIIDVEDGVKLNLLLHGLDLTGGSSSGFWSYGTPYLINLGSSWGIVDLSDTTGVTTSNISVTGPPTGNAGLRIYGSSGGRDGAMHQFSNYLLPTDTINQYRQDLVDTVNAQGGPLTVSQLAAPSPAPAVTCTTAGANTLYYKITSSNQPCFSGGSSTIAGTESAASSEGHVASCASPSITNPVTVTWKQPVGQLAASYGIYTSTSSGTETQYDCVAGDTPSVGGFPFLAPTYVDIGTGTGSGRSAPTADTGTGGATVAGLLTAGGDLATTSSHPTLTAGCNGAGSSVAGTDFSGVITTQSSGAATTCTLTKAGNACANAYDCLFTDANASVTPIAYSAGATSTTTAIVDFASATSAKIHYLCSCR